MIFTESELKAMPGLPGVLEALAEEYHNIKATEADAIGPELNECVAHHEARARELQREAERIRQKWESGE